MKSNSILSSDGTKSSDSIRNSITVSLCTWCLLCVVCGLFVISCTLLPEDFRRFIKGSDTGITRRAALVSNTPSDLVFETDLSFVLGHSSNLQIGYLNSSEFSFTGNGTYSIVDFNDVELSPPARS